RTGQRAGALRLRMGALAQDELTGAPPERFRVPLVDLEDAVVDLDLTRSLPEELLRRLEAAPVLRVGEEMTVIVADPTNQQAAAELASWTGTHVSTAMTARERVLHLLDKAFPPVARTAADAAQPEDPRPPPAPHL